MKKIFTLLGLSLFLLGIASCGRECPNDCQPPKKSYKIEGWIDDGSGQLKALTPALRSSISDKGITVHGLGDYTHNQPCGLYVTGAEVSAVEYVTFSYTAGYSPLDLPRTKIEYKNRRVQPVPPSYGSTSSKDLYFGFSVIGDVQFIIKKSLLPPGVDVNPE